MATDTGGFAEQLRDLKERSGLSYGALAKKLHVSTSTLHRYCNGDAVPTEFAPVERLGRLCGASREEMIRLHRGWILADDARGKGKAAAAPDEQEGGAEGAPAGGPAGEAAAAAEAPAATDADAVVTVQPLDRPSATTPSRPRKRLAMALAAAAVVALAVPVAYAVRDTADDTSGHDGGTVAGPTTGPDVSRTPPPTPSASGSGTPSASLSASASAPTSTTSGAPTPPSAEAPREETGTPVSVGISSYAWDGPCGQHIALDQEPGEVPPPPAPQDTRGWARALGGVDGGHVKLELTATGKTAEAVVLNALHVRVVERGAPLNRAAYFMGDGCGGGITPQTFDIDLDAARPLVKPVAGRDGDGIVPAKDFPYKVSTSDPQVLNLDVHTEAHVAAWYLELDWSSGDRHGTVRVDDGGKPFRTSAIEGKKQYAYLPGQGRWVAQ
ncbi:helix-turn-helix domain-containing protein [Streptomyces sp. NPDC003035]|uniref:helix-turn-helix domain-containing protein n=1 Tax=Streptomyces sp. NPDC003035 TaxID=3364676 RepID=UPI0036884C9D